MSPDAQWIAEPEALTRWLADAPAGPLAVDTEADSLHHYPEKICLIQLSRGSDHALVDPLASFDPAPLVGPLADPGVRKILHGADYDVRMLGRDFGLRLVNLFDTMIAARLTGESAFGLAALLSRHVGVQLDKRFQRADWSQRPLTREMRAYAILDTAHLAELAELLEARLVELGRMEWAQEEFRRLEALEWTEQPRESAFRRVKGAGKLNRRALAVLREVHGLREELARELDRPPFRVMRDETLLALTQIPEEAADPLADVPGLSRRFERPAWRRRLRAALEAAWALSEDECPERKAGERPRRPATWERDYRRLAAGRDRVAESEALEASLIAPRAVLERILERCERGEDWRASDGLRRWQADLLQPTVEQG